MTIDIGPATLTNTIEALQNLKAYYEADACALARIDDPKARELAKARLVSADTAAALMDFYTSI